MRENKVMDRRSFLKGATAVGAMAVAGGATMVSGCSSSASNESAAAESKSGELILDADTFANAKWTFEIAPDPVPEDKITETVECEILVIGAGMSGLVTATSALEQGGDVILIATSKTPVSRGGSNAAFNSRLTEKLGLNFTREQIEPIFQ